MKNIKEKIIKETLSFEARIAELKKDSNYYPEILIREYPDGHPAYHKKILFMSTLVRIKRSDKYYAIHVVQSVIEIPNITKADMYEYAFLKLITEVYKVIYLYKITDDFDSIDILQEEEKTRLINKLYMFKNQSYG